MGPPELQGTPRDHRVQLLSPAAPGRDSICHHGCDPSSQPELGPVFSSSLRSRRLSWIPAPSFQQLPPMSSRWGVGVQGLLGGEGGGSRGCCCFYLPGFVYGKGTSAWLPTIYSGEGTPPGTLLLLSRGAPSSSSPPPAAEAAEPGERPPIPGEAPSVSQRAAEQQEQLQGEHGLPCSDTSPQLWPPREQRVQLALGYP